jgi:hypothetical protein
MKNEKLELVGGLYGKKGLIKQIRTSEYIIDFNGDYGYELDEEAKIAIYCRLLQGENIFVVLVAFYDYFEDMFSEVLAKSYNGYTIFTLSKI